jgi:hypothetical protein
MSVKYLYDAKSAAIISSEGFWERLAEIVEEFVKGAVMGIDVAVKSFAKLLERVMDIDVVTMSIVEVLENYKPGHGVSGDEIKAALKSGNIKRVVKKIFSTLLEGKSIATKATIDTINQFVEELRIKIATDRNTQHLI